MRVSRNYAHLVGGINDLAWPSDEEPPLNAGLPERAPAAHLGRAAPSLNDGLGVLRRVGSVGACQRRSRQIDEV